MNQHMRASAPARLDGWKSIARYLGRDRTTAMRWAATRGLPVHSLPGGKRASVYAIGPELDAWMAAPEGFADHDRDRTPHAVVRRRALVLGALATAGLGIAGFGLGFRARTRLSPEEQSLMEQARLLLHQNTRETQNQAIGLFGEVVRSAPRNADAWGMLGYAYALASHWRARAESLMLREQARMCAHNTFDLDPGNAIGELALAAALPFLGASDWLARDRGLRRALNLRPDHPEVLFALGYILRFTGHSAEAAAMCERIDSRHHTPIVHNVSIRALWSAGRTEEADRKLAKAVSLFPSHKTIWQTRLEVLMFSGRADEAAKIAQDSQSRPSSVSEEELKALFALAERLLDDHPRRIDSFIQEQRKSAQESARSAINAIRFASVSGRLDQAFALADAYFFSRGFEVGERLGNGLFSPLDQRHTNFLFEPPAAAMRADRRFAMLTEELGLERYWREARRPPDYRHLDSPRDA